jgi:hypothetical protein
MRPTLPSPIFGILRSWAWFRVGAALLLVGCARSAPPVAPGAPIEAAPPAELRGMVEECDAMIAALEAFRGCPHLAEEDRLDLEAWIERAHKDFAAGRKANPSPEAQDAIALACQRATRSVAAATERCQAGPPPKDAWYPRGR